MFTEARQTLHISSLPVEVLLLIIKHALPATLVRATRPCMHPLFQEPREIMRLALVCRAFYCCMHDSEVWRHACRMLWGRVSMLGWCDDIIV